MSVPTKRKGMADGNNVSKLQKQSADEDISFSDREMEYVLKEMPTETLLRVVKSNSRLLPIARRFVQARYLDKCYEISNKMEPNSIEFLTYFGAVIRSLRLVYHEDYHRFDPKIEKLIFDCCSSAPYVIRLVNANRLSMLDIAKPFDNVTKVSLDTGTIFTALSRMSKWFPKLQTLELIDMRLACTPDDRFFSSEPCPELQVLYIRNLKSTDNGNGYMYEISALLVNSPKMEFIRIYHQDNIDELLKTMAEKRSDFPNLHLDLNYDSKKPVGTSSVHFKSLKSLNFVQFDNPFSISTDQIEKISIECESFDFNWLTLLKKNRTNVHTINMFAEKWSNDVLSMAFIALVKAMPNLRKVNMVTKLPTDLIFVLVSKSCSFEDGKFTLKDGENYKSLVDLLRPNWTCRCYSGNIFHIEKSNEPAKPSVKLELSSSSEDSTLGDSTSEDLSSE